MVKVNGDRLWQHLMEMAKIGGTPEGGVCRVALTDEDKKGRDLFIQWCESAGCTITIDEMGNIFARRPGKTNQPAVMIGSHLDSQPTGGKFDGVLGVLAGLEIVQTLNDHSIETEVPIEIVSWTNEEGARFSPAMIASGTFSGEFSLDYAYARKDKEGKTIHEELKRIGYLGKEPIGQRPYKATFELHIEQGPILEAEKKAVGIVTGVQGIYWYDLILKGKETHAGPSPMHYRKDPVKALSQLLPNMYQMVSDHGPDAKLTVGAIDAFPGVRNTVPGSLNVTVDLRHPNEEILQKMHEQLHKIVKNEEYLFGVQTTLEEVWYSPPIHFSPTCIDALKESVLTQGISAMEMVSGAGHDAVYVSQVAPTGMVFIPCADGISHHPSESAKKEDAIHGTNVMLHAVLTLANEKKT